ncbi:MAG: hypothetical protein C0501_14405 [Isosphaera sp.]|nr:hypothetical protein [Isosphaera sp.]
MTRHALALSAVLLAAAPAAAQPGVRVMPAYRPSGFIPGLPNPFTPRPVYPYTPVYNPYPYYPYPYTPSYPVYVSPTQVTGVTPWGGVNTAGATVYDSAFSPWRTASKANGSLHWESHPVYGPGGQIVGYKQGYAWVDSVTGQKHFDGTVVTPNATGGTNTQHVIRSANPTAGGTAVRTVATTTTAPRLRNRLGVRW